MESESLFKVKSLTDTGCQMYVEFVCLVFLFFSLEGTNGSCNVFLR